jgi:hypothetical protein
MFFNRPLEALERSAGALWAPHNILPQSAVPARSRRDPLALAMRRRDPLESSVHLSDPCLAIIDLFLECPDLCLETVMALLQPFLKAFYFVWSQFTDVETISDKVAH